MRLRGCTTKLIEVDAVKKEFLLLLDDFVPNKSENAVDSVFISVRAGNLVSKLSYPTLL